jgi:hypothetical protein
MSAAMPDEICIFMRIFIGSIGFAHLLILARPARAASCLILVQEKSPVLGALSC